MLKTKYIPECVRCKEVIYLYANRKIGNGFEKDLCISLAGYGFWTHRMTQNNQGQPFDILAARNGVSYPIDCKDCANDNFKLSRVEENQYCAMNRWQETGNGDGWFALRLTDSTVYFFSFNRINVLSTMKKVLSKIDIKTYGIPLGEWVERCA